MADNQVNEMRYGISALSMKYKEHATNDELLLNSSTGKPFYKREEDGQIVSFDNLTYSKNELPSVMNLAMANQSVTITTSPSDLVAYNTIEVAGKVNLFNTNANTLSINTEFNSSVNESAMYFRVYGDIYTNAIMSYLDEVYKKKTSELPEGERKSLIEVTFSITSGETTVDVTVGCEFNTLVIVPLSEYGSDTYKVKIKSIKSNVTKEVYDELSPEIKGIIKSCNNGNDRLEITHIDIVTYVSDANQISLHNGTDSVQLNYIAPMSFVDNVSSSTSVGGGDITTGEIVEEEITDSLFDALGTTV